MCKIVTFPQSTSIWRSRWRNLLKVILLFYIQCEKIVESLCCSQLLDNELCRFTQCVTHVPYSIRIGDNSVRWRDACPNILPGGISIRKFPNILLFSRLYGQRTHEWRLVSLTTHRKHSAAGLRWTLWESSDRMSPRCPWRIDAAKYMPC